MIACGMHQLLSWISTQVWLMLGGNGYEGGLDTLTYICYSIVLRTNSAKTVCLGRLNVTGRCSSMIPRCRFFSFCWVK